MGVEREREPTEQVVWFVCPFDVSALAEGLRKMEKRGSHGDLCHRVDMGGTVGDQVVRLHTTKPESARSTSGTWRSSGLRQHGLLGSHSTMPRQNPKSQCLLVQRGLLGPERDTTNANDTTVAKAFGEAQPPGIAEHSASTASELAVSSGEVGSARPGEKDTTNADVTAVATLAGEARPLGIAKQSA